MNLCLRKVTAILLLVLFGAAGLHMLVPHEVTDDHGQTCALCALFWTVAALTVAYLLRRRHVESRPIAPLSVHVPFLARIRPWSERAPPFPRFS